MDGGWSVGKIMTCYKLYSWNEVVVDVTGGRRIMGRKGGLGVPSALKELE